MEELVDGQEDPVPPVLPGSMLCHCGSKLLVLVFVAVLVLVPLVPEDPEPPSMFCHVDIRLLVPVPARGKNMIIIKVEVQCMYAFRASKTHHNKDPAVSPLQYACT
jgi:hypothetical protein